jgi:hypothetical protein
VGNGLTDWSQFWLCMTSSSVESSNSLSYSLSNRQIVNRASLAYEQTLIVFPIVTCASFRRLPCLTKHLTKYALAVTITPDTRHCGMQRCRLLPVNILRMVGAVYRKLGDEMKVMIQGIIERRRAGLDSPHELCRGQPDGSKGFFPLLA